MTTDADEIYKAALDHDLYILRRVIEGLKTAAKCAKPEDFQHAADEIGEAAKELYSLARDSHPVCVVCGVGLSEFDTEACGIDDPRCGARK